MSILQGLAAAGADLFLGSRCVACGESGASLCPGCWRAVYGAPRHAPPSPAPPGLPPTYAVAAYDGIARAAILAHKEDRVLSLARDLGRLLALSVLGVLAHPRCGGERMRQVGLVPVVSTRGAVRRRGHDPLRRITAACLRSLRASGIDARSVPALRMHRRVADQAGLDAGERSANLQWAYGVRRRHVPDLSRVPVIVVDDIVTTGATASEAARALRACGADVLGAAVIAATQRRGRPLFPVLRNG